MKDGGFMKTIGIILFMSATFFNLCTASASSCSLSIKFTGYDPVRNESISIAPRTNESKNSKLSTEWITTVDEFLISYNPNRCAPIKDKNGITTEWSCWQMGSQYIGKYNISSLDYQTDKNLKSYVNLLSLKNSELNFSDEKSYVLKIIADPISNGVPSDSPVNQFKNHVFLGSKMFLQIIDNDNKSRDIELHIKLSANCD